MLLCLRLSQITSTSSWIQVLFITNGILLWRSCMGEALFFPRLTEDKQSIMEINITIFKLLVKNMKPGPGIEDLNKAKLLQFMGDLYNPSYHSIKKPTDLKNTYSQVITEETLETSMPESLLKETFALTGVATKLKLHTKAKRYFRLFLQYKTLCPLNYNWLDLGESVWPRYFKETSCLQKSCSHPPGMNCGASDMKQIALLYWNCYARVKKSGARRCGWSIFKIKVISKCICLCGEK